MMKTATKTPWMALLLATSLLTLSACDSNEQTAEPTPVAMPAPEPTPGAVEAVPMETPEPENRVVLAGNDLAPPRIGAVQQPSQPTPARDVPTPPPTRPAPSTPSVPTAAAAPAASPVGNAPAFDLALRERIALALPEEGAEVFARLCADCHTVEEGQMLLGPSLFGVVGSPVALSGVYAYSPALRDLAAAGVVWDFERLDAFLASPRTVVPGTRMLIGDVADAYERSSLIAFLRLQAATPVPIEGVAAVTLDDRPAPSFTVEQADAGRHLYQVHGCGFCHGDDLRGLFDFRGSEYGGGPALLGSHFLQSWRANGLDALFIAMRDRMPPDARGSVTPDEFAEILAFILTRNGFAADGVELPADPSALAEMSLRQGVVLP